MSNKRPSETQDANLFSPKRNQRKQMPYCIPPQNNAPQPVFSLPQTAVPPHPMPVTVKNNLVLPQPSNALATAYQVPESVKSLKLSTIGIKHFPNEGVDGAYVIRTQWRKSKRNQYGKMQQNGFIRHKSVTECAVGALAFFLLYRWEVAGYLIPNFESKTFGLRQDQPITYSSQYSTLKEAFPNIGINSQQWLAQIEIK
ncbi:hypothetical protein BC833DRAFT_626557 [Globomyces pollinis-pini]|nr:hypothetical protein BC833DRAFT_626557 [Globomyces pollinis-pini]